jgi:ribosomal protein S18 acetylase RimI-like enzyme
MVEVAVDAPTQSWWDACTLGEFELTRFELVPRTGGKSIATAVFRSMESSGSTFMGRAAGLIDLSVDPAYRRRGIAVFLLSEAFRQFTRQGIMQVEFQAQQSNAAMLGLAAKFGFVQLDQGGVWKKG